MHVLDYHFINYAVSAVKFAGKNGGLYGTGIAINDNDIFAGAHCRSTDKTYFSSFEHNIAGFNALCDAVKFKHSDCLDHLLSLLISTLSVTAVTSPSKLA